MNELLFGRAILEHARTGASFSFTPARSINLYRLGDIGLPFAVGRTRESQPDDPAAADH
jgi:hypothetical protein